MPSSFFPSAKAFTLSGSKLARMSLQPMLNFCASHPEVEELVLKGNVECTRADMEQLFQRIPKVKVLRPPTSSLPSSSV